VPPIPSPFVDNEAENQTDLYWAKKHCVMPRYVWNELLQNVDATGCCYFRLCF